MQKDLNFQVASMAGDAYDVNDIVNSLPRTLLTLDEESESVGGIEEAINYVRENKPHLFKKDNKSGMTSGRPEGVTRDKSFEEKLNEDPNSMLSEVLSSFIK